MLPPKPKSDTRDSDGQELTSREAPVRPIGEDDDGYDPYTDWHDQPQREPMYEPDPWK